LEYSKPGLRYNEISIAGNSHFEVWNRAVIAMGDTIDMDKFFRKFKFWVGVDDHFRLLPCATNPIN